MNNEPVAWKAYDEVNFSDQYILRWVREGDEYVNRITKEMMEDLHAVVRQQQAEIEQLRSLSLRRENLGYFYDLHARQQAEIEALKSKLEQYEILEIMITDTLQKAQQNDTTK